jgi:1-acyl-sn-glycerol-3-phosphate acyltransferase
LILYRFWKALRTFQNLFTACKEIDMTLYDPKLVARLEAINLDDILVSLGWDHIRHARRLLEWPFRGLARRFAYQVLDFNQAVVDAGLHCGSQNFLRKMVADLVIEGQLSIPADGPVLFLSNHPGLFDTVSLFASIPREDLRIVAAERPFLRALPAVDPQLIYVSEANANGISVLRSAAAHLRAGGAVLTFPAGHIEPDPTVLPGARQSLDSWSSSIGLFARLEPAAMVVPVIVSGVLSPQATYHPLTRLRRKRTDRERLGATLQIMASVFWPSLWKDLWKVKIQVRFGEPISAASLVGLHDPKAITQAVIEKIRPMLEQF